MFHKKVFAHFLVPGLVFVLFGVCVCQFWPFNVWRSSHGGTSAVVEPSSSATPSHQPIQVNQPTSVVPTPAPRPLSAFEQLNALPVATDPPAFSAKFVNAAFSTSWAAADNPGWQYRLDALSDLRAGRWLVRTHDTHLDSALSNNEYIVVEPWRVHYQGYEINRLDRRYAVHWGLRAGLLNDAEKNLYETIVADDSIEFGVRVSLDPESSLKEPRKIIVLFPRHVWRVSP